MLALIRSGLQPGFKKKDQSEKIDRIRVKKIFRMRFLLAAELSNEKY